jgi:hypothetical protein
VHVGAVDRKRGEYLGEHRAGVLSVRLRDDRAQQPGQPGHLGRQRAASDLPLRRHRDLSEPGGRAVVARQAAEPGVLGGERVAAGRVEEQPVDHPQRVVAGGSRARPVGRQLLIRAEDLLGHHPGAAGRGGQPAQVAARIGEPVRVVHPQPVHQPLGHQADDDLVGGVEHGRVLDPDADQRGDVEEPPPVEAGGGVLPPGEPVVLCLKQAAHGQLRRAWPQRQDVIEVPEHRLAVRARPGLDPQVVKAGSDRAAQDRQQHPVVLGRPVDVEPAGVRGIPAVAQHRPELPVQRQVGWHRHVVGHDVEDDAKPAGVQLVRQRAEPVLAAEPGADQRVVGDVVAVL